MKQIENKKEILFFLDSLIDKPIPEDETFEFKMELTEVIFKPRSKAKKTKFCKQMDMDVFEAIMNDLELPYKIKTVREVSQNYYIVEKE